VEARLGQQLRDHAPEILNAWMDALRSDPVCQPTALVDELAICSAPVLEALGRAFQEGPADLAAPHFREAVRELSFVGGWLAGQQASASLVSKYIPTLGELLRQRVAGPSASWRTVRGLERELEAVALETYCRSLRSELRQQQQELLERCSPVLRLTAGAVALLVVGAPQREVLSSLCGRLLMEGLRRDARTLVVDFSWCAEVVESAWDVLERLLEHRKLRGRRLILCAAPPPLWRHLQRVTSSPAEVLWMSSWEEGLAAVDPAPLDD
jgi:hypothetical protein